MDTSRFCIHCQFNVILCNSILYLKNHNYFVDGPDSLKIIPSLSAWENSPFNLTCSASCYKGCWSYSWYSDSKKRVVEPDNKYSDVS